MRSARYPWLPRCRLPLLQARGGQREALAVRALDRIEHVVPTCSCLTPAPAIGHASGSAFPALHCAARTAGTARTARYAAVQRAVLRTTAMRPYEPGIARLRSIPPCSSVICDPPGYGINITAMLAERRAAGLGLDIGLAWHAPSSGGGNPAIAWHDGGTGGYRAFVGLDRSAGVGVVVLTNAATVAGVSDIGAHLLAGKEARQRCNGARRVVRLQRRGHKSAALRRIRRTVSADACADFHDQPRRRFPVRPAHGATERGDFSGRRRAVLLQDDRCANHVRDRRGRPRRSPSAASGRAESASRTARLRSFGRLRRSRDEESPRPCALRS